MTAPVPEMRRAIEWLDYDASTVSVSANDLAAVLDAAEALAEHVKFFADIYGDEMDTAALARWRELTGEVER